MARPRQSVPLAIVLGGGVTLSVLAVLVAYATWPLPPGPETGAPPFSPLLFILFTVLGGAITGIGLSRPVAVGRRWLRTTVLGVVCIAVVMTVIVAYGRRVAPRYWDDPGLVGVYYRVVLGVGGALLLGMGLFDWVAADGRP